MSESSTPTWLYDYQQRAERQILRFLPDPKDTPDKLHQAMHYATLNGGKRIRPVLVYATGVALGIPLETLDAPAAAVEFIHAYSLVHDDLPAMDDDDLRRGKPTCHIAYDEATAILTGDALQTLAFSTLCEQHGENVSDQQRLSMVRLLAHASGSRGMAGGQAIDLESVGKGLSLTQLENMHLMKTGALIQASVKLGALCRYHESHENVLLLNDFATKMGLAFQIQDDVLDIESDTVTLGKTQGADQALNKPTYPALLGLDGAKQRAKDLHAQALSSLKQINSDTEQLSWIADYIILRKS